MATAKLKLGNGIWATKQKSLLAYNDEGNNFKSITFNVERLSGASYVGRNGLIQNAASDEPRIDFTSYSKGGLLIEPQRTNLFERSEEFDNSYWTKARSSITANQITSPSGANTADKLIDSTDNNTHLVFRSLTVSTSNAYTFSCFLKKGSLNKAFLAFDATTSQSVIFNLENGTVESQGTGVTSSSIIKFTNDWYKCSLTHTPTTTTRLYRIGTYNGSISYTGTGSDFVYLFGAQLEADDYSTSYIPTAGSAATRTVETVKINDFPNAPTGYPFTIFCDFDLVKTGQKSFMFSFLYLASASNYFTTGYNIDGAGNFFKFENRAQGTALGVRTTSTYTEGRHKLGIKFISSTNFKAFIDGLQVADHTHTAITFNSNIKDFLLGQLRVISDTGDRTPINEFKVFNEALTDAELQTLTTL